MAPPAAQTCSSPPVPPPRRSDSYKPSHWDYAFIQSLDSNVEETQKARLEVLIKEVRQLFDVHADAEFSPVALLKLVDHVQQLGIGYHFEEEIEGALDFLSRERAGVLGWKDLHSTSLLFRLLRDNRHQVSQDIFHDFLDEGGLQQQLCHSQDLEGLLALYEASYHCHEGEDLLDEARAFAAKHLRSFMDSDVLDSTMRERVRHALELPLHRRVRRLHARWFIDACAAQTGVNPVVLELAKCDYNVVQWMHRDEIKQASVWWSNLRLTETVRFSRDRIMESYLWAMGICSYEPQFGNCRIWMTKIVALITVLDDLYDVYGTLDELELFTEIIERWDANAISQLPEYMKIIFLAVYNNANELGYEMLRDKSLDITQQLRKLVGVICKAYFVEAKWYHNKYKPTFEEYIENGWLSAAGFTLIGHFLVMTNKDITETFEFLFQYPDLLRWSCTIGRLADDIVGSERELQRGDIPKAIECYMYQKNVMKPAAYDYIANMINNIWKKLDRGISANNIFPRTFVEATVNFSRICHTFYLYGDAYSFPDKRMKENIRSLLIDNIPHLVENI